MFSHVFCLLICRLNANTTEWIYMQVSRNIANRPKRNTVISFWWQSGLSLIVVRDSSLYPKQMSLFCLLWLICTNFAKTLVWKTWIWRQIMTSQTMQTNFKWSPYDTEWNPHENFLRTPLISNTMVFKLFYAATDFATQFNLTNSFRKFPVRHMKCSCGCTTENHNN